MVVGTTGESAKLDTVDWPTPRAAYVHVPFCRHRCGYCNFSVLAGRDDYADAYLEALENELAQLRQPRRVDTIFIGGGTPTHLPAEWLKRLLELVCHWFPLATAGEFSVEANPGDVNREKLNVLKESGVNRVSLGVQSFQADKLRQLERDHDRCVAESAIEFAAEVIGNVSIDLIFASPGETTANWDEDLRTALRLPINHLSTYGLTFEKGTRFWNRLNQGELSVAGEETELAMYKHAIVSCHKAGWRHYEVSNFARPGYECRHNKAYWEGRGWYAAGPGAASFVGGFRNVNHRSPTTYIRKLLEGKSAVAEAEPIDRQTWARERLVFGLRMLDGVDLQVIADETEYRIGEACEAALLRLQQAGMLELRGSLVRLTENGLYVSDSVLSELL